MLQNDKGEWKMNGPKVMALSVTSARHCPQSEFNDGCVCAIPRSHSDIVKFEENDAQYDKVRTILEAMARDTTESNSNVPLTKDEKECMRALWFSGMDNRSAAIGPATQGTCTWVLKESTYKQWSSADRGLLWIQGHPGVGKSTLIKFIMEEIKRTRYVDKMRSIVVSFFFNKRAADDLEKTRLGFYRSVLHQLLGQCPEALGGLVTSFSRRKDTSGQVGKDWYWQEQDLCRNLAHAVCSILDSYALWLFVDALDESNEGTTGTMVRDFKLLLKVNPSRDANLHICFTSRHFPVVAADCDFKLQLDQKNVGDIEKYVLDEFSNRCQQLSSSEIPKIIITRAHGIFLWARVALEEAIRLHHAGRGLPFIVQALKRLPPELQDLFRSIIMSGAEKASSLQVMQWICFAKKALTLDELRWAIIVDDDKSKLSVADCREDPSFIADDDSMTRRLRTLSCGLAEVVDTETFEGTPKRIQFIHETVKEFFLNHGLRLLRGTGVDSGSDLTATTTREQRLGHYRLARTCIRYLSIVDLSSYQAKALSRAEMAVALEYRFKRWGFQWQDFPLDAQRKEEKQAREVTCQSEIEGLERHLWELEKLMETDLPFFQYAVGYWMSHVKGCEENSTDKDDILDYPPWPKEDIFKQVTDIFHYVYWLIR
ncbi:Vegetative incompatibility protein HET-E-1 [Beauveria bassiana]|nr:Vegetative incompatibility protein HET-E-1 [Beauveria bassiana]